MAWSIQVRLDTAPDTLRVVRHIIALLAREHGASSDVASSLELAVGEALINAHEHAYDGHPGPLEIDLVADDLSLAVAIHDHGRPVTDVPRIPRDAPSLSSGHYGLYLIGQLMDRVQIVHPVSERGGTAIRMVKHWTRPERGRDAPRV
jgi:anti-sigma regulatory factor (Ser/Thr protein kinase)